MAWPKKTSSCFEIIVGSRAVVRNEVEQRFTCFSPRATRLQHGHTTSQPRCRLGCNAMLSDFPVLTCIRSCVYDPVAWVALRIHHHGQDTGQFCDPKDLWRGPSPSHTNAPPRFSPPAATNLCSIILSLRDCHRNGGIHNGTLLKRLFFSPLGVIPWRSTHLVARTLRLSFE